MENAFVPDQDVVLSLAASPEFASDGVCFVARNSGLYRSGDGGSIWQPAYQSLGSAPATIVVAVSPAFATDRSVFAGVAGGILRSHDGGQTWIPVSLGSPPPLVSTLTMSPGFRDDGILLAGTVEDGVFRSTDLGASWAPANVGLLDPSVLAMAMSPTFVDDGIIVLGTATGLYRSTNGGRSWHDTEFPTNLAPVLSVALSPQYARDNTIFAGTESFGLLQSRDQGQTWTRLGEHVISTEVTDIVLSERFPGRPEMLVLHDAKISISDDYGESWSEHETSLMNEEEIMSVTVLDRASLTSTLLIGLANGVVRRF